MSSELNSVKLKLSECMSTLTNSNSQVMFYEFKEFLHWLTDANITSQLDWLIKNM